MGSIIVSCAAGGKSIKFKKLPIRSNEYSVFTKCIDGDKMNVCKYECTEYKNNNECKKDHEKVKKMDIRKALNAEYYMIKKAYLMQLLKAAK